MRRSVVITGLDRSKPLPSVAATSPIASDALARCAPDSPDNSGHRPPDSQLSGASGSHQELSRPKTSFFVLRIYARAEPNRTIPKQTEPNRAKPNQKFCLEGPSDTK